jgi:hypothetical protein
MIRRALETPALYALGAMTTVIAALVGTVLAMVLTFPFSLIAVIFFPILIAGFVLALVLVAPVTFLLLPLTAQLMRGHPILTQLVVPVVGFIAGGAIIAGWTAAGVLPRDEWFSAIGMVSGLSGGGFFVRGLYA